MRIQHNIMAMNAYRNYNTNTSALSKNLEKLSSGYKINRAGDDAAGLAISEKMRAQITGLNAAQKNVKDGISLVKTAEGAMQEIQDMLNRMDYLATQSANGTYDDPVDRLNLQKEVDALKTEINRIADSANFNGIQLLDGSQSSAGASAVASDVAVDVIADAKLLPGGWKGDAKQGVYELDLSQFKFKATGTSGDTGTLSIKIGGKEVAKISVTIGTNGSITGKFADTTGKIAVTLGADLTAGTITGNTNGVTPGATSVVNIGGTSFGVSLNTTTNKITLTMLDVPTSEADLNRDMTVSFSQTGDAKFDTGVTDDTTSNQGNTWGVKIASGTEPPRVGEERQWAQAEFDLSKLDIADGAQLKIGSKTYTFKLSTDNKASGADVIDMTKYNTASMSKDEIARLAGQLLTQKTNDEFMITSKNNDGKVQLTEKEGTKYPDENSNVDYDKNDLQGGSGTQDGNWKGLVQFTGAASAVAKKGGLTLQIGDTAKDYNQMTVSIGDMHTKSMVTAQNGQNVSIQDINISTQDGAKNAIDIIRGAINYVSGVRGDLGAVQNRLEHTANNLSVMAENIQDAESTIRDTDVAEEMMAYTKNNILVQSAQAMLAQANAVPQGVLQLLG